ncbi:hypothetical protein [Nocardioides sp.]|uniref:hypothetical protein n=1 Tax=Nocardioides sp. TaxID=35761 RepID=UPI003561F786
MLKVLLVLLLFAALTYGLIRVIERRGVAGRTARPTKPQPPRRPVAPDDDVDFLRDLDRKRRQPPDPDQPTG